MTPWVPTHLAGSRRQFDNSASGAEVLKRFDIAGADGILAVLAERFGICLPPGTPLSFP